MLRRASSAFARRAWLLALVSLTACRPGPRQDDRDSKEASATPTSTATTTVAISGEGGASSPCPGSTASADAPCPEIVQAPACDDPVPIWAEGQSERSICPAAAAAAGLTLVDLSDDWAPRVLVGDPEVGPVPYRDRYVRIAREDFGDDDTWYRARRDRFHELYGIFPTPSVVASRLADDERHACHGAVPRVGLETYERGIDTWRSVAKQRGDLLWRDSLHDQLVDAARRLGLSSVDELEGHPQLGARYERYHDITLRKEVVSEAQQHFACEGLLDVAPEREGLMDGATISAMQAYLRRHMVITWQIDDEARRIMLADSRELDLLQLLRTLRERVVDATGLLEDGTAINEHVRVADRVIDTATFLEERAEEPMPDGAHDLIGAATDAAARALGWTSVEGALAFFASSPPAVVAVRLPDVPVYHQPHTELRLVIDRGDVWYDFPFHPNGDRELQPRDRLPMTSLYAKHGDGWIPLVRWPTTIGGWQPERLGNGQVKLVYKESPPGPRIVKDLVAAPRWIPPRSTPDRDLLRPRVGGGWSLRYDTMGPDYASAYGLAMLIHHRVDELPDGEVLYTDQGIRSHGSVSYDSILDGFSHGCHRLHNHRAVRLAGFLLAHRRYEAKGEIPLDFHRTIVFRGRRFQMHFDSRGYRYQLDPPLEVEVLEGRIRGRARRPLPPRPLTRPMLKRYR